MWFVIFLYTYIDIDGDRFLEFLASIILAPEAAVPAKPQLGLYSIYLESPSAIAADRQRAAALML